MRVAGALRDIDNEKCLAEASERQVAQLSASSAQLAGVSADLSRAVDAAVSRAAAATETIAHLDASSAKIGEVIKLITGIASQTNLLALNATSEAVRSIQEIDASMQALASTQQAIDNLIHTATGGV